MKKRVVHYERHEFFDALVRSGTETKIARRCSAKGCDQVTRNRKPYCTTHLFSLGYPAWLAWRVEVIEAETDALNRAQRIDIPRSALAAELLRLVAAGVTSEEHQHQRLSDWSLTSRGFSRLVLLCRVEGFLAIDGFQHLTEKGRRHLRHLQERDLVEIRRERRGEA